jgi:hypothetical protein
MAVDYLKTYLNIDPNDYSAMELPARRSSDQFATRDTIPTQ